MNVTVFVFVFVFVFVRLVNANVFVFVPLVNANVSAILSLFAYLSLLDVLLVTCLCVCLRAAQLVTESEDDMVERAGALAPPAPAVAGDYSSCQAAADLRSLRAGMREVCGLGFRGGGLEARVRDKG